MIHQHVPLVTLVGLDLPATPVRQVGLDKTVTLAPQTSVLLELVTLVTWDSVAVPAIRVTHIKNSVFITVLNRQAPDTLCCCHSQELIVTSSQVE